MFRRSKKAQVENEHKLLPLEPLPENGEGDNPTTQTHQSIRLNKDYRRHRSLTAQIKIWWHRLFIHPRQANKDIDTTPLTSTLAQQELGIFLNSGDHQCDDFSSHFLEETKAAIIGSRLDLDKLVKDNTIGILSADSLESLGVEMYERNCQWAPYESQPNGDFSDQCNNTTTEEK
nr:expressed protein [Hymenolepis microstoma]